MKVAIIGAGVIGLSTAIKLFEIFPNIDITIFAEKVTPDTTSDVAAGIWFPYAVGDNKLQIEKWCRSSHVFLTNLIRTDPNHHKHGIILQDLYRLSDKDNVEMAFVDKLLWNSRFMNEMELKMFGNTAHGIAATTFIIQGIIFLPYLMKRFTSKGGRISRMRVECFDMIQTKENFSVIVNCTGLGARELCNDSEVCPVRGQIIRVQAPWIRYAIFHGSSYIIPQCDGTVVLGGTLQKNDSNLLPDDSDTKNIMEKCCRLMPGLKECKVLKVSVGLRPYRSTVRLEREMRTNKINGDKYTIIHNYGHGGSGMTLFWGCAENVAELMKETIVHGRI